MTSIIVLAIALLTVGVTSVDAQICGNPTGSGAVSVTDGVQVLREAADLSSTCTPAVCDTDGSSTVTVTDGVNVLRAAALLPATLTCGSEVASFISSVSVESGGQAVLDIGVAPIPEQGAPVTVGTPTGATSVSGGGSNQVTIPYNVPSQAAVVQMEDLEMIIAINLPEENDRFATGFFRIPLEERTGEVRVTANYPAGIGSQFFLFCPATREGGVLSEYGILEQQPVSQ